MQMQVTAQRRPDFAAAEILCRRAQFDKGVGLTAGPGLGDHLGRLRSYARQRLPTVGLTVPLPLRVVQALDDVGGVAVGHHPPRVFPRTVLEVGDLSQSDYRVHRSSVPAG